MRPTIGRIVIYRSRTGFDVPAIIAATQDTLEAKGLDLHRESGGTRGVPPLESDMHVHLVCFTPGIPGVYPESADMPSTPSGGTFQEWGIGPAGDGDPQPGTWRWPTRE